MTPRRFVYPKVTEIRVSRGEPQAQAIATPTQRDLVAASLLFCPEAGQPRGAAQGRAA